MFVAATAEVEIAFAVFVVEIDISIDDGILRVEDGAIVEVGEGTCRRVTDGNTNLEVLTLVSRVLAVVGAEEEVVLAIAFIDLGSPEAVKIPLCGVSALVDLSAGIPLNQVIADESLEAITQRSAVHVVAPVACMKQEGIAQLEGNRVRHGACLCFNLFAGVASHEAKAQECQREQVFHYCRMINNYELWTMNYEL